MVRSKQRCMYFQLSTGGFFSKAYWKHEHVPVYPVASALLIHAWLDWMHTYLHLMNSEVSCAECRRGHQSCSGVSCVPVCCAEIRCLSGPVTVYNIIFGDGEEMILLFHCCHLSTASCRAGWYLFFFTVSNSARGVNGSCLLSKQAFVFTASFGRDVCISACPRSFVSMTTVFEEVFFASSCLLSRTPALALVAKP